MAKAAAPPIPRIELANAPTPLLKLERLSPALGAELWVKRDDLTGLLESGNKVRKLEFLIGDALAQSADTLVICGTAESNGCRAVAAAAARLGLRALLVLKGERPAIPDGNHLLDRLLGADIHYCPDAAWGQVDEVLADLTARLRREGRAPYITPRAERGSRARVRDHVRDVIEGARRRYALPVRAPHEVRLLSGEGTAQAAKAAALETVLHVTREEGIVLDPLHTGPAFRELLHALRAWPGAMGRRVCFVHTGGIFSLFPFRAERARLLDGASLVNS